MAGFDEGPDSGELGWYRGHRARPLGAGFFVLYGDKMIKQHEDLFKLNEELAELVADTFGARDFHPSTQAQINILFFVTKGYKSLRAILLLCRHGYGEDAGILLRSLFEIAVNAWYIKDNEELAKRYGDFIEIHVHELLEDLTFEFVRERISEDKMRERREGYDKAQEMHKYKGRISWSGKTLKVMAEEVGLSEGYSSVYVLMSQLNHTTAGAMLDYIQTDKQTDKGGSVSGVKLLPSDNLIREVLLSAVPPMLNIVKQWHKQFNLGIEAKIMEIDSRLIELQAKYV